jgi:DGQHR domain-containing protein
LKLDKQQQQTLTQLLDSYLNSDDRLLVQKTEMGETAAFVSSVTLQWVHRHVGFASELPLFQQQLDPQTQDVERSAQTINEILQRPLDWSRQAPLAQYIAIRQNHKFPALLVVVSPDWVDDPDAPQWDKNQRAKQSAVDFTALDAKETVGVVELPSYSSIFALDGQHRLMGIQGLMELLETGKLPQYSKVKKPVGSEITIEDLVGEYHVNRRQLQNLATEKIGIEFLPAVAKGETRDEARQRIRSIFVHANLMAVKLSKGQLALLDEDNGFSIVSREIAVTHPLLRQEAGRNPRINWDSATVAAKSTVLTTLQALKDMVQVYLEPKFPHWHSPKPGLIPLRPDNQELQEGIEAVTQLFDYLMELPSYQKLQQGWETPSLRRFYFEKPGGEGNILFRPVGQVALAKALGNLVYRQQFSLEEIFAKLHRYDEKGGFSRIENPASLWYGVLYDPNKGRIRVAGRDLAAKLIVYIVGGVRDRLERAEIRTALAKARTFEDKTINFSGRWVQPKEVGLPKKL